MAIPTRALTSLATGFRRVERYFSLQESAVFRAKIQLMHAFSGGNTSCNFEDFHSILGVGKNLGSTNADFQKVVMKTHQQIKAMAAGGLAAPCCATVSRAENGVATATFDPRFDHAMVDRVAKRLLAHVRAIEAKDFRLQSKLLIGEVPQSSALKLRWIAEIVASGFVSLPASDSFLVGGASRDDYDADMALAQMSISALTAAPAERVDISSKDESDWLISIAKSRAVQIEEYHKLFTTAYSEERRLPKARYWYGRKFGITSIFQDIMKDLRIFQDDEHGQASREFVATLSRVQKVTVGETEVAADTRLAAEWETNPEAMTRNVKLLFNAACRAFGFGYWEVDRFGNRVGDEKPARIIKGGSDFIGMSRVAEFLSAIEAYRIGKIKAIECGLGGHYLFENSAVETMKELDRDTTFVLRRGFVIKYLRSNVDFSGTCKSASPTILGIGGGLDIKDVMGFSTADGRNRRESPSTKLSFGQQMALHRMQIQIMKVELEKFIANGASKVQLCTIGHGYRYRGFAGGGGDVVDPELHEGEQFHSDGFLTSPKHWKRDTNDGRFSGVYWLSAIFHAFTSLFYLRSQDPSQLSPSESILMATLGEDIMRMSANCCASCLGRSSVGTYMSIAAKSFLPTRYPGYPIFFWGEDNEPYHPDKAVVYEGHHIGDMCPNQDVGFAATSFDSNFSEMLRIRSTLHSAWKCLGGCASLGFVLSGGHQLIAKFGTIDGGGDDYYERFGKEPCDITSAGPTANFVSSRYAKHGVQVAVGRHGEPWYIKVKVTTGEDSLFGGNAKSAILLRNRQDLLDAGIAQYVPEALSSGQYDMWLEIDETTDPPGLHGGTARVRFAKRDAEPGKCPTVDFVLECVGFQDYKIRDTRGAIDGDGVVLFAKERSIGRIVKPHSGLDYFSSFIGGNEDRLIVTASENPKLAVRSVEIGGLKYDSDTPLVFVSKQFGGTPPSDGLALIRHPSLRVVPKLICRPTKPGSKAAKQKFNPLFSCDSGIVLRDVDSSSERYELLVRAKDIFLSESPQTAKFADEIINVSFRPKDFSARPDNYFCDTPSGYLAVALLALRNSPAEYRDAASLIRKARTRSGISPNEFERALYAELIRTIDGFGDEVEWKDHMKALCMFRCHCDSGVDALTSMTTAELDKVAIFFNDYVAKEKERRVDGRSRGGSAAPDYRLVLSAGEISRYVTLFSDAETLLKIDRRNKGRHDCDTRFATLSRNIVSLKDSAQSIFQMEYNDSAAIKRSSPAVVKISDAANALGARLHRARTARVQLLREENPHAAATAKVADLERAVGDAKRKLEGLLNKTTDRGLTAADAVPLLLLVGQTSDDATRYHTARFMSRLMTLNSELSVNDVASIFETTVSYVEAQCDYNFYSAVARGARPPVEEVTDGASDIYDSKNGTLHLASLAYEFLEGIILRKEQLLQLSQAISYVTPEDDRKRLGAANGRIVSVVMGGGKTKVITPLGALMENAKGGLPVVLVPTSLVPSVNKDLTDALGVAVEVQYLGAIAGSNTDRNWLSNFSKDTAILEKMVSIIKRARTEHDIVLLVDDAMMNRIVMQLLLDIVQFITAGDAGVPEDLTKRVAAIAFILNTFRHRARLFIDEAHKVLDPMCSLITADQNASDVKVDNYIFDTVQQIYTALSESDPDIVDVELVLNTYANSARSGWTADTSSAAKRATLKVTANDFREARDLAKLAQNGQASVTDEAYTDKIAPVLAKYMLLRILGEHKCNEEGCGVRLSTTGAARSTSNFEDVRVVFGFGGGPDQIFECKLTDLASYVISKDFSGEDTSSVQSTTFASLSDIQSLYNTGLCARFAIDAAFTFGSKNQVSLSPLLDKLFLLRGMMSCELRRCLLKTAGVHYGEGADGSALRVYKEGTPTNSQFAHLAMLISLLFQYVVNMGIGRAVWDEYITSTAKSATLEQAQDPSIKSPDETSAGKMFIAAFHGQAENRGISLSTLDTNP
ncbi:MAG: hypothetical protein LBB38_04120, partial [Puniceicoccales bacterium]|nr:hypothetical protein [Puniceicoccales bacterium]